MININSVGKQQILIWILLLFAFGVILFKTAETVDKLPTLQPLQKVFSGQFMRENTDLNNVKERANKTDVEDEKLIEYLLGEERSKLQLKFQNFSFHPGLNVSSLAELVPEMGGRPAHNIILSTWRSGTTFLGELLISHPGSFYHYEPLLPYGINQLRYDPLARPAIKDLLKLMKCDYSDMDHFIQYGKSNLFLFSHTEQIFKVYKEYGNLCFEPRFLEAMCKLFPFQQMKIVRLRIRYIEEFLSDKSLRTRVLLLVRDPRGTLQSRKHRDWCPQNPDCYSAEKLCRDLLDDYYTAKAFSLLFQDSFRVIRYEDLSFDIYNKSRDILDFFNMNYHPDVAVFLGSHTKKSVGGVSSTFRDSRRAPIHWKDDLTWAEVNEIQQKCDRALIHWGYKIAANETHLRSFNPIGKFNPHDMNVFL